MTAKPEPLDLAFNVSGEGPPLLILHGLFGWKRNWGAISRTLSAHHRVFCLDLRNHGESPWSDVMTYDAMAADISHFIKTHTGGKADIIGHSMGGKAAMMTALAHPEQVGKLCIVDIAPTPSPGGFKTYADIMLSAPVSAAKSRSEIEKYISTVVPEQGTRAFLVQNLEKAEEAFRWRPNVSVIAEAMEDIMQFPTRVLGHSFMGKTLFIGGGQSDYIRPEHHGAIEAFFPKASIDVIPGAGHWVHAENTPLFLQKVRAFFG